MFFIFVPVPNWGYSMMMIDWLAIINSLATTLVPVTSVHKKFRSTINSLLILYVYEFILDPTLNVHMAV